MAIFSCRPHPLLPRESNLHVKKSDRLFHESTRDYRKFLSSLELQSPQLKKTPYFTSLMRALQFLIYCCCCRYYFYYCHYYYHQHLSLCIVLSLRKASQRPRLTLSPKVLTSVSRSSYSESFSVTLTEVVLSKRFAT